MLTTLLLFFIIHAPKQPYVLEYVCDSGWGELTADVCPEVVGDEESALHAAHRSFATRQQAIDWIETNFAYWPIKLVHGETAMSCEVDYLDAENLDMWRAHQKEVDCDTKENLEKRHGTEPGREWQ